VLSSHSLHAWRGACARMQSAPTASRSHVQMEPRAGTGSLNARLTAQQPPRPTPSNAQVGHTNYVGPVEFVPPGATPDLPNGAIVSGALCRGCGSSQWLQSPVHKVESSKQAGRAQSSRLTTHLNSTKPISIKPVSTKPISTKPRFVRHHRARVGPRQRHRAGGAAGPRVPGHCAGGAAWGRHRVGVRGQVGGDAGAACG